MTKDLEMTIMELGPAYGDVVRRVMRSRRPLFRRRPFAAAPLAAAACAALAFGVFFLRPSTCETPRRPMAHIYTVAYNRSAAPELVRTQNPDGSWANDFVTRQNAAALSDATDSAARLAYRKAMHYIRLKGLSPLSRDEFAARSSLCAAWCRQ